MPIKSGVLKVDKSQKIKSQKLHVPILETNRKNLHPHKKKSVNMYPLKKKV